jgi:hypothetical protein
MGARFSRWDKMCGMRIPIDSLLFSLLLVAFAVMGLFFVRIVRRRNSVSIL